MPKKFKKGDIVKVPKGLTTDPVNKQGHEGKIIRVSLDSISVKFDDGTVGLYQNDAIELVKRTSLKKSTQYSKTHKSKKAADSHERKIKARGGKVTRKGNKLDYHFPK